MRTRRAFTLVEVLVGLALFSLILLVVAEAINYGLKAHRKGEAARQAQAFARTILDKLTTEAATGVTLDTFQLPRDFMSAVVWPDTYMERGTEFVPTSVYGRQRPTENNVEIDRVSNRFIFTRPAVNVASDTYNQRDYTQFVYVEYLVAPPDAEGRGQHQLLRRVYRVATAPGEGPRGNILTGNTRFINRDFFTIPTYVASTPLAIFANQFTTVAALPAQQQAAQTVIAELPANTDQISFTVEHSRGRDSLTAPPDRLNRFPYFDASLFSLNVTVSLGRTRSLPTPEYLAVRSLSGQARVTSGQ